MSGIVGSFFNHRGSGVVSKLGTDGHTFNSGGAGKKALTEAVVVVADGVDGSKLADDAVDSEHYTDGSIDNAHIADDAIDSEHYAAASIDNAHLADDAVDSDELAAGSVDTAHIADNQVTLAKMAGLARGKLIYGDSSGDPAALAVGSADEVLTHDGTDLAWASAGGGKIGQAVTATRADDTSNTTTSYADTNCTVAITPSAADSKILVHISIPTWIYRGGYVSCRYGAKINRAISGGATTALVTSGAANNLGGRLSDSPGSDDDVGVMFNYTLLDAPSTSSAVTYSVQFALDNADGTSYVVANVSNTTSYMTALEVLA